MRKILALVLLVGSAGCGNTARNTTTATTSPPKVGTTTAPAPQTPVAPTTTTTQPGPSAYDQLAGFAQAAEKMDLQLRHAAELINGAGPPWTSPLPATVLSSVQAADLQPVAATIPTGLPSELLRQTILALLALPWVDHGRERAGSGGQ